MRYTVRPLRLRVPDIVVATGSPPVGYAVEAKTGTALLLSGRELEGIRSSAHTAVVAVLVFPDRAPLIALFEKLPSLASATSRVRTIDGPSSRRALAFRGWASEADEVVKALTAAGIVTEIMETAVPALIGGVLMVSEVFVRVADLAPALRTVAPIVRGQKPI